MYYFFNVMEESCLSIFEYYEKWQNLFFKTRVGINFPVPIYGIWAKRQQYGRKEMNGDEDGEMKEPLHTFEECEVSVHFVSFYFRVRDRDDSEEGEHVVNGLVLVLEVGQQFCLRIQVPALGSVLVRRLVVHRVPF